MTLLYVKDIFLFLCIFGFGYLLGVFTVFMIVVFNVIKGNTITIKKELENF